MSVLERLRDIYLQRGMSADERKKRVGRVAGYFCNSVPEELLIAAGFFPLRLRGNPARTTTLADKYTDPYFQPDIRSSLEALLRNDFNIDYLVVPHSRDAVYYVYNHLERIKEIEPGVKLPPKYLFDILRTKNWASQQYCFERFLELKAKIEEWAGKVITDDSLRRAIELTNESRRLLKSIASYRMANQVRLSGTDALQIIGSAILSEKEEHNQLLQSLLDEIPCQKIVEGTKLFVLGSPLDYFTPYLTIESCGAVIVGEDSCWGDRYYEDEINTQLEPMESLFEKYYLKNLCPAMHPMLPRLEYQIQRIKETGARGVIVYLLEWDNVPAWEYPTLRKMLAELDIPCLLLDMQKYPLSQSDGDRLKERIFGFLNSDIKEVK